jgi:predicted transcriptional regulator
MRKNIDIDEVTLTKLKILAVFENNSVKGLMEEAVHYFVIQKEKQRIDNLTQEEKEDLGLLLLMQQADRSDFVNREEVMEILNEE